MTRVFSSPNWGQAFRMYNNTRAWGYDPEYKQKDDIHIVNSEGTALEFPILVLMG